MIKYLGSTRSLKGCFMDDGDYISHVDEIKEVLDTFEDGIQIDWRITDKNNLYVILIPNYAKHHVDEEYLSNKAQEFIEYYNHAIESIKKQK